jgi:DNA-binding response OmpR family regulator
MSANVLIVEDEFLIAMQLEDIVTSGGHTVVGIVCDHASLGGIGEPPQVALVDLNLRDGPSGLAIAMDLARRHGTRILYVTANPSQIVQPAPTAVGVVQKPFSPRTILAAIAIAIGNDNARAACSAETEINLFPRAI